MVSQVCAKSSANVHRDHARVLRQITAALALVLGAWVAGTACAFAGVDEAEALSVSSTGVQIYDCRADSKGQLSWQFREPLATLIHDGKTIGRHFGGPNWQLDDGSEIVGKVIAQSPGATPKDISLLKFDVLNHLGNGVLSKVTSVQRVDTLGGVFAGAYDRAGDLHVYVIPWVSILCRLSAFGGQGRPYGLPPPSTTEQVKRRRTGVLLCTVRPAVHPPKTNQPPMLIMQGRSGCRCRLAWRARKNFRPAD